MVLSVAIVISACPVVLKLAEDAGSDLYLVLIVVVLVGIVVILFLRVHGEGVIEVAVARAVDQVLSEGMIALVTLTFPPLEQVKGETSEHGAKLPIGTLFVLIKNDIGLEYLAEDVPELRWPR